MSNTGHEIVSDIDYVGAFLFETIEKPSEHTRSRPPHVAPRRMIPSENPDDYPAAPPPVSGYREADVQGVACWNCGHFTVVGDNDDDGVVDGICNLWETQADGEFTCDRFTAHLDLFRQQPHTSWQEDNEDAARGVEAPRWRGASVMEADYSDNSILHEINFSSSDSPAEDEGLIWKDILRTGFWNSMPTKKGVIKKKMQIVRDGVTDFAKDIATISLKEIFDNFQAKAVPYVTVPLSDDLQDHKNIARLNTGFVRQLRLVDRDGVSVLRAGIEFTEPDVKEKVLRGTYPDVSAGVPYGVTRRSDEKLFGSVLDHVCITAKPFLDRLGPFGIAAADGGEIPTEAWEQEGEVPARLPQEPSPQLPSQDITWAQRSRAIADALRNQMNLSSEYLVEDFGEDFAIIRHQISRSSWRASYTSDGNVIVLDPVSKWKFVEENKETASEPVSVAASDAKSELERARELRELRLAQPTSEPGGTLMSTLDLDGVELSDEARASIQAIISDNDRLRREGRVSKVDKRIDELLGIPGFKDRPGALKLYREIMLSDDEGPAIILFSDGPEKREEKLTALEIIDRFIDALVLVDTGVQFSDQAFSSGNDRKPPRDASGEKAPLEERTKEAQQALYGKRNPNGGRK